MSSIAGRADFGRALRTLISRLESKRYIHPFTGCWLWTGHTRKGYGYIRIAGKAERVHRVAWREYVGKIENLILHKQNCPHKHCFNPGHLYDGNEQNNACDREAVKANARASR